MPFQLFSLEDLFLSFNMFITILQSREMAFQLHKHSSKTCINLNKTVQTASK